MSSFPPTVLKVAAEAVATLLRTRKESISVAETAAGGLISAALLSTPGASAFYKGGLTLYTLQSRIEFAGWTQANIEGYKGPTPEVVTGLAENVRQKLGSTYCVSESGTAGPTGGNTKNRTPGYVALAVASEHGPTLSTELDTGNGSNREQNMVDFAVKALELVKEAIEKSSGAKM